MTTFQSPISRASGGSELGYSTKRRLKYYCSLTDVYVGLRPSMQLSQRRPMAIA